jgi:hypothetical protein
MPPKYKPTFEGWLTQPTCKSHPSEGHASAVRVLRNINSPLQHMAAEPVPFSPAKPAPVKLRSIKPAPRRTGCAGTGGACISHPDCPDTHCEGHPDNMGPQTEVDPELRAVVWCCAACGLAAFWAVVAWIVFG